MADQQHGPLPAYVTMPLLARVTRQSLDQDYVDAAQRRADAPDSPAVRRAAVGGMLGVVTVFGLLLSTAAVQESRTPEVQASSRASLISQIEKRRDQLTDYQDRLGGLEAGIDTLERRTTDLADAEGAATARLERLLTRTGFGPVRGPGVQIVVDDSPSGVATEVVRDTDLAQLVDALWSVGAEAIAVNEQRLTVLSSIRNVGTAVHVNGVPLAPPYVVEAIGNPDTMPADLATSPRGAAFFGLADALTLVYSIRGQSELALPAAPLRPLRWADETGAVENGASGTDRAGDADAGEQRVSAKEGGTS